MTRKFRLMPILLPVLLLAAPRAMFSQAPTAAALAGTVTDPSGAVISGARVTIMRPATGYSQTVTSNSVGGYIFPDLQAGRYTLKVSANGFRGHQINGVVVQTGRTLNLNVSMTVGSTTQTVEVSTAAQVLETTINTLSTTITPDAVQDLPLNGRDALPFAQLVAGAQTGGDQRFTTYDAMPNAAINITVDGMNDNFQRFRTSSTGFFDAAPLRIGAVQEATVSTNDLTADAGAEGGATLGFELKRGTNHFHGGAFWETQNSAFNANTYLNNAEGIKRTPFHISDFGGDVGGPIWKNKVFFFGNYEQEYVPGNTESYGSVLSPAAQGGVFTYVGTDGNVHNINVLNVAAANGFPSTVNSAVAGEFSQINPTVSKALSNVPNPAFPYQDELAWQYRWNFDQIYPTLRFDYQIRPDIEWNASYDLEWRTYPGYQAYPGDPYTNSSFNSSYQTYTTGFEWTITPKLVNQFNAGLLNTQEEFNVGHGWNPFTPENDLIIDAPYFVNGGQTLLPYLPNYYLPEPRNNPVKNFTDNLSWTDGNHTFTLGGDLRNSTDFDTGVNDPVGNYLGLSNLDPALGMFNSTNFPYMNFNEANNQDPANAEALYATLTGRINYFYGTNYVNSATHQYQTLGVMKQPEAQTVGGFYFQDAWRLTPHFALNYGFRWQFSGAVHNTNNTYTNPTLASLMGPSTQLFHPGQLNGVQNPQVSLRPAPYRGDMKEPAPNVGFAWNPDLTKGFLGKLAGGSNLVIRGGAAVTWYDEGWTTFEQATLYSNPGDTQVVSENPGPTTNTPPGEFPAGSLSLGAAPNLNGFPATFSFPVPESDFTFAFQPFATVDPNIRSPYIENWYFGLQRQFPSHTVVQVNYVGNHSVHMWMNYDLNEVNIFENGFLSEFKAAQANLASYEANNPNCGNTGTCSFEGSPGALPLMEQAFGTGGSGFTNPTNVTNVGTGQAGALAYAIADNPTWFCNLVGTGNGGSFSPCANLGYTGGTPYPVNVFQANPFASGEPIMLLSDPGSESYNGLQIQVKHPTGHNLVLQANYAYSHAFTNRYIGDYYTGDEAIGNFVTLRNRKLSRGPSPQDLRHTLTAYALYTLPFRPHSRLMKEAFGGWTLSPIVEWHTGENFKMLGGTNTFNYFAGSGQPDASDSGVVLHGVTTKQLQKQVGYYPSPSTPSTPMLLMNPKVFTSGEVTPEETPGTLGQFVFLHGPQFFNTDFAATKLFPIAEAVELDIQAEMLNAFNHPNWNYVDGYSGGTNNPAQYVTVTNSPAAPGAEINPEGLQSGGARDIQFRVQLVF
jgi:hypothetical protein